MMIHEKGKEITYLATDLKVDFNYAGCDFSLLDNRLYVSLRGVGVRASNRAFSDWLTAMNELIKMNISKDEIDKHFKSIVKEEESHLGVRVEKYSYEVRRVAPENPRTCGDELLSTMVCFHKRYSIGDTGHRYKFMDFPRWSDLREAIVKDHRPTLILPIYMRDHDGIILSTTPFGDRWDSGQVGFAYSTTENMPEDSLKNLVMDEVEIYGKYLIGDGWGFTIKDSKGKEVEACEGFFEEEVCETEAKAALKRAEDVSEFKAIEMFGNLLTNAV